jgi:hypothetical protein
MFHWNGDCTFYVALKIGGDSKKMMGLGAISFDKAFRRYPQLPTRHIHGPFFEKKFT